MSANGPRPKVSIITVTLNRPSLREACLSVEAQTRAGWHHYVIGDGVPPTDFRHPNRTSFGFSRPLGVEEPGANMPDGTPNPLQRWALEHLQLDDYVCFLDDDNLYRPQFLEKMVGALEAAPERGVAVCAVEDLRYGQKIDGWPAYGRCDNSGFLARRGVVKAVPFPRASPGRHVVQDCEFIETCAALYGWVRVPETLVVFGASPNLPALRGGVKVLESWESPLKAERLMRAGDYTGAVAALREAVELDPHDAWSRWKLGEALLCQGRREEWREEWREWLRLVEGAGTPGHFSVLYLAALAHSVLLEPGVEGLLASARRGIDAHIAENPDDPELPLNRALYDLLAGEADEALARFRAAQGRALSSRVLEEVRWHLRILRLALPDVAGADRASDILDSVESAG